MYSSSESLSDCESSHESNRANDDITDESPGVDDFEDRIIHAMESTTLKSSKAKSAALEIMCKAFSSRYLVDFVHDRCSSVTEIIERSIKHGRPDEQGLGAWLLALVSITLGVSDEVDDLLNDFKSHLIATVRDESVNAAVRSRFASALGICCFIAESGNDLMDDLMDVFYSIFSFSYHKGNGVAPVHIPEISHLHMVALQAWSLLLTIQPTANALKIADRHIRRVIELLDSSDVALRMVAGETIALLFELRRDSSHTRYVKLNNEHLLTEKLSELATDSQKFRGKKERKVQRSTFRDVMKYVESGVSPDTMVKFGVEILDIDSWCRKLQYNAFCNILGSGMNHHLARNELLRDIFGLGPIPNFYLTSSSRKQKFENIIFSQLSIVGINSMAELDG